jgi:hypothetical protein
MATLLRWLGRILILLAIFVLIASLFLPSSVQALNPLVCPDGTELDNHVYNAPGTAEDQELDLVCTSKSYTESAARKVFLVVGGLVVVGLGSLYVSQRLSRQQFRRPSTPPLH